MSEMKKILIFGVNGFTGIHLYRYLREVEKREIVGTYFKKLNSSTREHLEGCRLKSCNINEISQIKRVLKLVNPEQIYFLPAIVTVGASFERATEIYDTNILGLMKFFEAFIGVGCKSKILVVGSAEEYGKVKKSVLPIKESQPLNPANPYGFSKAMQDQLVKYCSGNYHLFVHRTRTFHFTGPLQPNSFVVSDFASQIAQIEAGLKKPVISVGNLRAKRDFTDIRDIVRAYYLIMNKVKEPDVFNVCSNRSVSIEVILEKMISESSTKIKVKQDSKKLRRLDVPDFRGDNSKLVKKTGWKEEVSFNQMLKDVLNYHRQLVKV